MKVQLIVYKAKDGWRWHAKRSGRIIAESGEGYVQRSKCRRSLKNFIAALVAGKFVEVV